MCLFHYLQTGSRETRNRYEVAIQHIIGEVAEKNSKVAHPARHNAGTTL